MNDKQKLAKAFRAIRANGIHASLGVNGCCRSCIWYEKGSEWETKPVLWFYKGQGNTLSYDDNGDLVSHQTIHLNHNGGMYPNQIARCVEILKENGLDAQWNGDETSCVSVTFATIRS